MVRFEKRTHRAQLAAGRGEFPKTFHFLFHDECNFRKIRVRARRPLSRNRNYAYFDRRLFRPTPAISNRNYFLCKIQISGGFDFRILRMRIFLNFDYGIEN